MKDKAFARGVKREDLRAGAELLGLAASSEHIGNVIAFMRERGRRAWGCAAPCERNDPFNSRDLHGTRSL